MMPVLTFKELHFLMLVAFLFGIAIGAIYEIFRMLRWFFCKKRKSLGKNILFYHLPTFIFDFIFCVLLSFVFVALFSSYGGGKIRGGAAAALFCGWMLWHNTLGRLTIRLSVLIEGLIGAICCFIYKHTIYHLVKGYGILAKKYKDKRNRAELEKYQKLMQAELNEFFDREY